MPRDGSGNYTLPAGNPVISGTIIETTWANPTMADVASALTDSLSRSGSGGMLVPFLNADGTGPLPGIAWVNQPNMGFYRPGLNEQRMSIASVDKFRSTATAPLEIWDGALWVPVLATSGATLELTNPNPVNIADSDVALLVGTNGDVTLNPHIQIGPAGVQAKTDETSAAQLELNPEGGIIAIGQIRGPNESDVIRTYYNSDISAQFQTGDIRLMGTVLADPTVPDGNTCELNFYDLNGVNHWGSIGWSGSAELSITNLGEAAAVNIIGRAAGGGIRSMATFLPEGAVSLSFDNVTQLLTADEDTADLQVGVQVRHNDGSFYGVGLINFPVVELDAAADVGEAQYMHKIIHKDSGAQVYNLDQNANVQVGARFKIFNESGGDIALTAGTGVAVRYFRGDSVQSIATAGTFTLNPGAVVNVYKYNDIEYWIEGVGIDYSTSIANTYAGYVDSAATSEQVPAGWSASRSGVGSYTVTHNLGLSSGQDLSVTTACIDNNTLLSANIFNQLANSFDIRLLDSVGLVDSPFHFIAQLNS